MNSVFLHLELFLDEQRHKIYLEISLNQPVPFQKCAYFGCESVKTENSASQLSEISPAVLCLCFSLPVARSAHGATVYSDKLWIFAGYDGNARFV